MSEQLALGLLIQLAAALLITLRVGRRAITHSGALFALVACFYHGAWEVVQLLFPDRNPFRTLLLPQELDEWILIPSCGILLFAIFYVAALRKPATLSASPEGVARLVGLVPDWRLLLILALPAFWLRISGLEAGYWLRSASEYLAHFVLVIAAACCVLKWGASALIPALLAQSAILALSGARSMVVINGVVLLSALARLGIPIRAKRLAAAGAMMALLVLGVSVARTVGGRLDQTTETPTAASRAGWLATGLESLADLEAVMSAVSADFVYRFDGNSFPAMVCRQMGNGVPPAGLASLWNNFALMVPSAVNPDKLQSDQTLLFEEDYSIWHYGLPRGIDYIQTVTGTFYSYYGTPGFLLIMCMMGLLYAFLDRWINCSAAPAAQLAGIGLAYTAVFMEFGVLVYFTTFRSLLLLFLLLAAVSVASRGGASAAHRVMRKLRGQSAEDPDLSRHRSC